jgi:hypothetical protein
MTMNSVSAYQFVNQLSALMLWFNNLKRRFLGCKTYRD